MSCMARSFLMTSFAVVALLFRSHCAEAATGWQDQWTSYRNARFGFTITYPTALFVPEPERENANGRAMISTDGRARLLVGAFQNADRGRLDDYRAFLLKESYAGAKLDYAPVRDSWFVLSGTRGSDMFYERVTFTCGGRVINSWAMIYPASERHIYDRVVERVAKTYMPGNGPRGSCD